MLKKLLAWACLMGFAVPSLFAEDAYIESDGTQVLLTDYYPTEKMQLIVDFAMVTDTASTAFLGNKASGHTGTTFQVWQNSDRNVEGNFISAENKDIWSGRLKTGTGTSRYTLKADEVEGSFVLLNPDGSLASPEHGVKKPAGTRRTGTGKYPLALFANPLALPDATFTGAKMKLYGVTISEDGTVIRQLVPCRKGDRLGLYDEKTKKFFGAFVGNQLKAGGDILTVADDPCVELDGTDYIQTDYVPKANTRVELDFALTDLKGQQFLLDAGCLEDSTDDLLVRAYVNGWDATGNGFSWAFTDKGEKFVFTDDNHQVKPVALRRQQAILDGVANKAQFAVDGVVVAERSITTAHTATSRSADLRLFHNRYSSIWTKGRIYGLKISEGGVLKRDYVAVREGGRTFLRDTLSGEEVFPTQQQPYVAAAGNQYVLLDYITSQKSVVELEYSDLAAEKVKRIFGTESMQLWLNDNGNQEFYSHSAWSGGFAGVPDQRRHHAVIDTPQSKIYFTDATYGSSKSVDMKTRGGYAETSVTSTNPMMLFNRNNGKPILTEGSTARIYSVKVTEDGELIHLYQPYAQDGLVGFKDVKTGKFFPGLIQNGTTAIASTLTCGGAVACGETEAYVECDQSQYILLDYLAKPTTKLELDFQLTKLKNDYYLFGCHKDPTWSFYVNGGYGYTFLAQSKWDGGRTTTQTALMADLQRTTVVLDRPNGTAQIRRADMTKNYTLADIMSGTQSVKMGLFARQESNGQHFPNTPGTVPMRVYSLRIWESGVLKMELLPYQDAERKGLKDTVSGTVYTSTIGNPLVINGKGHKTAEGNVVDFETALSAAALVKYKGTTTLGPVYAPGAVKYVWTKDGEVIADANGPSLDIAWQKKPAAATYAVKPVYNVYGTETEGEASICEVSFARAGLAILVR